MADERRRDIPGRPEAVNERLRQANERLTLHALIAQELADASAQHYRDEHTQNERLLKKQRQLRLLTSDALLTEQRERRQLATALHDCLGQMMVLGRWQIGQTRTRLAAAGAAVVPLIDDLDDIFTKSLAYIQTLMAQLSPPVLYDPCCMNWDYHRPFDLWRSRRRHRTG